MTYIPYDSSIPQFPTDSLETSQPQLLNNFLSLYNAFAKNHVALDATSGAGNHTIVQLLEKQNALQTDVGEISVYTKNIEGSTDQVFLRYQGNGEEFAYTCYQIYALTPIPTQTSYFTFLPGKILVYFGSYNNLTENILNLYPPIAKKIITVSVCTNVNSQLQARPIVDLVDPNTNGFYTGIKITYSNLGSALSGYYLVLANI